MTGPILEGKGMCAIFQKKGKKKCKKGRNIRKFRHKCTKFENILKKSSLMRATIACMKQLKYALYDITLLFAGTYAVILGH